MTKSDPVIVEFFGEAGIAMPPAVVNYNLEGISKSTLKRRLPELVERGLLEKVDETKGYYEITEMGRDYLAGDLDADDLENSNEAE
ncbi:ArsR family transcriptional regulator [Halovivax limisalsi]|uniref:ArsR family transcriptional regulator n=1 Tax=Halovivax limisalsi TaxID=1453760 RepID=UPI003CCCB106